MPLRLVASVLLKRLKSLPVSKASTNIYHLTAIPPSQLRHPGLLSPFLFFLLLFLPALPAHTPGMCLTAILIV